MAVKHAGCDRRGVRVVRRERSGGRGVADYYPSVENGARTVELMPIEENFGSMDAIARLVKNTKAVA